MKIVKRSLFIVWIFVGLFTFAMAENSDFKVKKVGIDMKICTMDAKMCSDGSYVGRVAPDCNFAPCPKSKEEKEIEKPVIDPVPVEAIIVGNDKDEYGCITSAGYIWNEDKRECVRSWEEEAEKKEEEKPVTLCPLFKITAKCPNGTDWKYVINENGCEIPTCYLKDELEDKSPKKDNNLLDKIKNAQSEEERVKILKEESEDKQKEEGNKKQNNERGVAAENYEKPTINTETIEGKTEKVISKKSKELFTKFDIIINKLKKVTEILNSKVFLLEESGLDVTELKEKLTVLAEQIVSIENSKAAAWILMQKTIDLNNKTEAKNNLESVKIMLKSLKSEIKITSLEIKDFINSLKEILNK